MRLSEKHRTMASHLYLPHRSGSARRTISGYYPPSGGPWLWDSIQANAGGGNIAILHSVDDSIVPFDEGKYVAQKSMSRCTASGVSL